MGGARQLKPAHAVRQLLECCFAHRLDNRTPPGVPQHFRLIGRLELDEHRGRQVASGSWNGEIRVWEIAEGQLLQTFNASPGLAQAAVLTPRK